MAKDKVKAKLGPPMKLTDENRVKLKEAAALDASVEEMAYYCDVSKQTVYNWFKREPDLFDEIERLRSRPVLKARQTVVKSLETPAGAQWYLSRKRKGEFSERSEITGKDGEPLITSVKELSDNELEHIATASEAGTSEEGTS